MVQNKTFAILIRRIVILTTDLSDHIRTPTILYFVFFLNDRPFIWDETI